MVETGAKMVFAAFLGGASIPMTPEATKQTARQGDVRKSRASCYHRGHARPRCRTAALRHRPRAEWTTTARGWQRLRRDGPTGGAHLDAEPATCATRPIAHHAHAS